MKSETNSSQILIIGAGAAGLMAALELAKAGKQVTILEARDRIGGRIFPLDEEKFGYPVQGGAEFVHGKAELTKYLAKEAGLTCVSDKGDIWSSRNGVLEKHASFLDEHTELLDALARLDHDMSITEFLNTFLAEDTHKDLRNEIIKIVEGYDAADPHDISTLELKNEWLSTTNQWDDSRIIGGYGALLTFLRNECETRNVSIQLNTCVTSVHHSNEKVAVSTSQGNTYEAGKIIITVPLPTLKNIQFTPAIPEKLALADKIGFGNVIKVTFKFKTRWWDTIQGKDLRTMSFLLCNERFLTWWPQCPTINTILTGWMAGPVVKEYAHLSDDELLNIALKDLSKVLSVDLQQIKNEVEVSQISNWTADPFTLGAYSYTKVETGDAYEKLAEPINNTLFFAGEAFAPENTATATVDGALASGKKVVEIILSR